MAAHSLTKLSDIAFEALANRFRALGEVSRLRIVESLQRGEKSVNEIVEATGLSQPNVSRHLQVLVSAALVGRRKDGVSVLYRIIDDSLSKVCAIVCKDIARSKS